MKERRIRTDGDSGRAGWTCEVELLNVLCVTSRLKGENVDGGRVGAEHVEDANMHRQQYFLGENLTSRLTPCRRR